MTFIPLTQKQENMVQRWKKHLPPIRPSNDIVRLYLKNMQTVLKERPNANWGILGCTPEIRSLAGMYQAKITCIDNNPDAFYAYKTISNPSKYEEFICSDWLHLNYKGVFDIVLGDGAMSMLPKKDHAKFLANIYKIIKPRGFAILKIHTVAPLILNTPQKIFDWYHEREDNFPIYSTRPYLYALWLNKNTLCLSNAEYQSKILEIQRNGIINHEDYNELNSIRNPVFFIQYTKKEIFENLISSYFEIISIDYAEDYPLHKNHPLYFLRKKE